MSFFPRSIFSACLILLLFCSSINLLFAADYYMSVSGDDSNPGTIKKPFASIQQANKILKAGDTLFIRGGTYKLQQKDISRYDKNLFARVIYFDKSGKKGAPIVYSAFKGERPIFDFSLVKPDNYRVYAFSV